MKKCFFALTALFLTIFLLSNSIFPWRNNPSANAETNIQYSLEDIKNLQNFILAEETPDLSNKNYDLDGNGVWNVFDLCLMKRQFAQCCQSDTFKIKVTVNGKVLNATLYNNSTTRALIEQFPMTLHMSDLYNREMCYRFADALPAEDVQYTGYEVGEIVYWPPRHSFVIMYAQNGEHFDMQKIGKIDSGVELFENTGDVDVTFELTEQSTDHTLIAYFSLSDIVPDGADAVTYATPSIGNTKSVAEEIQKQTGGDLFEIKTDFQYPENHRECSSIAVNQYNEEARPTLTTYIENINQYDTIYIGFPIWVYREPMVIRSFLDEYNLSGKKIYPFCTSMAVGIENSVEDIKELCPNAKVVDGFRFATEQESYTEQVSDWIGKHIESSTEIPIKLTVDDLTLDGYLYNTKAGESFMSQLPMTIQLNDSDNDFCGGNLNIEYDENDVQYGYKNGDIMFWTPANNFVIFISDEEYSANTGNLVPLGHITSSSELLNKLSGTITITISPAD